jgi:hypothetical protein
MNTAPTPDSIMQLGLGFWGSKTLLSAVELDLFSLLAAAGPLDLPTLRDRLGLHERSARDFFDALVALGMLHRTDGPRPAYANTPHTAMYLDRAKPTYVGGLLEMANARLYPFWGSPQNEVAAGGNLFRALYADPARLRQFLGGMTGISLPAAEAIARVFPWKDRRTFIDVGGAQGAVPVTLARAHSHLSGGNFDLPPVGPIFDDYVKSFGLSERLKFHPGNFFSDPIPPADVLIMGHILHDWNLDEKLTLLKKAYDALPRGGALIVYEALIDDDRRTNAFGLLMSLNMLIETEGGFDYSGADCTGWMARVGFSSSSVHHLVGPDSMVVGIK